MRRFLEEHQTPPKRTRLSVQLGMAEGRPTSQNRDVGHPDLWPFGSRELAALELGGAEEKAGGEGGLRVGDGSAADAVLYGDGGEGVALTVLDGDLLKAGLLLGGVGGNLGEDGGTGAVADLDLQETGFKEALLFLRIYLRWGLEADTR